ncbi:MAG: hypothetical protein NTY23_14310, partial [Chloroflexi bacterium]|nr:hypothetical protein [Chloroflexota bacterium]
MEPRELDLRRWLVTALFAVLAIAAFIVGWRVTQIDLVKLLTSLPKSQSILSDLVHPDLVTQKTTDTTL